MVLAKFAHRKLKFEKRKNAILNDNHHGLRTERAFVSKIPKFWDWADKLGQKIWRHISATILLL